MTKDEVYKEVLELQKERADLLLEIIKIREEALTLTQLWNEKALKVVKIENEILGRINVGQDKDTELGSRGQA